MKILSQYYNFTKAYVAVFILQDIPNYVCNQGRYLGNVNGIVLYWRQYIDAVIVTCFYHDINDTAQLFINMDSW